MNGDELGLVVYHQLSVNQNINQVFLCVHQNKMNRRGSLDQNKQPLFLYNKQLKFSFFQLRLNGQALMRICGHVAEKHLLLGVLLTIKKTCDIR